MAAQHSTYIYTHMAVYEFHEYHGYDRDFSRKKRLTGDWARLGLEEAGVGMAWRGMARSWGLGL